MFKSIEFAGPDAKGVAHLRLSRPGVRNALTAQMRMELAAAIKHAGDVAKVLVIEGQGKFFCVGHDFASEPATSPAEVERVLAEEYAPLIEVIEACPIPIIAAVNGPAIGVGVALALACDILIMHERAFFSLPFLELGLVPDAGCLRFLKRRAGSQRALGAALFGERISAKKAAEWGLAWEMATRQEFSGQCARRAAHIAALPEVAVRGLKELDRGLEPSSAKESLALEARLQSRCVKFALDQGEVTAQAN